MISWMLVVLLVVLAATIFILGRVLRLSTHPYSFRTLIREITPNQEPSKWHRVFACYGATHMASYRLVRFSIAPDLLFSRNEVEFVEVPNGDLPNGMTLLRMSSEGRKFELILSTADHNGLLCWVDSVPPKETALY